MFDAIIQNFDRHTENPNCLVRGDRIKIIDHELAFAHRLLFNWREPWVTGGMSNIEAPNRHIFLDELKEGMPFDFEPIRNSWNNLSNERLRIYESSIPQEWEDACQCVEDALNLVASAKDNIDGCIRELLRILS